MMMMMNNIKIVLLIILTLAISGCVNKKETALENCADDLYVNFFEKSMTLVFHDRKNPRIVGIAKTLKTTRIKAKKISDNHTKHTKKNYFYDGDGEGLKIIYDKNKITSPEERKKYENAILAESKKLLDQTIYWRKETAYLQDALNGEKNSSAYEIFWKAKLKRKIKVNQYYQKYKECEKEYTEAPDAFVLRWND